MTVVGWLLSGGAYGSLYRYAKSGKGSDALHAMAAATEIAEIYLIALKWMIDNPRDTMIGAAAVIGAVFVGIEAGRQIGRRLGDNVHAEVIKFIKGEVGP